MNNRPKIVSKLFVQIALTIVVFTSIQTVMAADLFFKDANGNVYRVQGEKIQFLNSGPELITPTTTQTAQPVNVEAGNTQSGSAPSITTETCKMPTPLTRFVVKENQSLTSVIRQHDPELAKTCLLEKITSDLKARPETSHINPSKVQPNFCVVYQRNGRFNTCSNTNVNGVLMKP